MAKNLTSRGISAGFPRYFRAMAIKALLNSRRGNHVCLVKFSLSAGIPRNFPRENEPRFDPRGLARLLNSELRAQERGKYPGKSG